MLQCIALVFLLVFIVSSIASSKWRSACFLSIIVGAEDRVKIVLRVEMRNAIKFSNLAGEFAPFQAPDPSALRYGLSTDSFLPCSGVVSSR